MRKLYDLKVMALTIFKQPLLSLMHQSSSNISHCYQSRVIEYEDFLDRNCDGSNNRTSLLAHIYMTSHANNKVYNLKEMLKQPGRSLL